MFFPLKGKRIGHIITLLCLAILSALMFLIFLWPDFFFSLHHSLFIEQKQKLVELPAKIRSVTPKPAIRPPDDDKRGEQADPGAGLLNRYIPPIVRDPAAWERFLNPGGDK